MYISVDAYAMRHVKEYEPLLVFVKVDPLRTTVSRIVTGTREMARLYIFYLHAVASDSIRRWPLLNFL